MSPTVAAQTPAPGHQEEARPRPTDTLAIRITGFDSYVQVTTWNNHLLVSRILHHGQRLAYRQHGLRVVLGNAGAVRISLAGHRPRRAGRPGQVRSFRTG